MSETPLTDLEQLADQLIKNWPGAWFTPMNYSAISHVDKIKKTLGMGMDLYGGEQSAISSIIALLGKEQLIAQLGDLVAMARIRYSENYGAMVRRKAEEAAQREKERLLEVAGLLELRLAEQKKREELAALARVEKEALEQERNKLGNLTLTGYNPEYSDRPFTEKLTMKNGFKDSPLRLNSYIKQASKWDENSIVSRAKILSEQGCKIWPMLDISAEVMSRYQTKVENSHSSYTLDDHPQLLRGENEQLFSAFRQAMLALDPCVTEVFLKLYVAYKAETNFVDVIPKAKGMRLTLNLSPHELDDPKEISKDISDKVRWGNGDVSVDFNNLSELPYIIGLIRQSFEKQMGAGESNT
jgi:predicted transport protein